MPNSNWILSLAEDGSLNNNRSPLSVHNQHNLHDFDDPSITPFVSSEWSMNCSDFFENIGSSFIANKSTNHLLNDKAKSGNEAWNSDWNVEQKKVAATSSSSWATTASIGQSQYSRQTSQKDRSEISDTPSLEDERLPLSVFVGNIPKDVSVDMLRRVLQSKGTPTDIICDYRPRCWLTAFVTYSKYSEVVKTVEYLNNKRAFKNCHDHRLVCCVAPQPPASLCGPMQQSFKRNNHSAQLQPFFPRHAPNNGNKDISLRCPASKFSLLKDGPTGANLFIYGIPSDWTEVTLMRLCQEFGYIVGIRVPVSPCAGIPRRNKGFGFVSYDSTESSTRALQILSGRIFLGKPLNVQLKQGEQLAHLPNNGISHSSSHTPHRNKGHNFISKSFKQRQNGSLHDRNKMFQHRKDSETLSGRSNNGRQENSSYDSKLLNQNTITGNKFNFLTANLARHSGIKSNTIDPFVFASSPTDPFSTKNADILDQSAQSKDETTYIPSKSNNTVAHNPFLRTLLQLLSTETSTQTQNALRGLSEIIANASESELETFLKSLESQQQHQNQNEDIDVNTTIFESPCLKASLISDRRQHNDIIRLKENNYENTSSEINPLTSSLFSTPIERHLNQLLF